jgi:hypothetical protein
MGGGGHVLDLDASAETSRSRMVVGTGEGEKALRSHDSTTLALLPNNPRRSDHPALLLYCDYLLQPSPPSGPLSTNASDLR